MKITFERISAASKGEAIFGLDGLTITGIFQITFFKNESDQIKAGNLSNKAKFAFLVLIRKFSDSYGK